VAKAERGAVGGPGGGSGPARGVSAGKGAAAASGVSPDPSSGGGTISVPHHASGARLARQQLAAELERRVPPALRADAVAVAAELLGNAVRHAAPLPGNVIHFVWRVDTDADETIVELRVSDGGSPNVPRERTPEPESLDGRGLAIVAALAGSWGVERDGDGQVVWARLRATNGPLGV
jgi:anti-sigma regulatory factor (Ser/Thr protein kinase)